MRRRSTSLLATVALTVAVTLSGCAAASDEIAAGTSELMQSTIVTAAGQAASGDSTNALATLDTLQAQLQDALAAGDITAERAATVQQSIDLVRADLQPVPAVAPAPEETGVPDETPVLEETTGPVTNTDPAPEPEPATPEERGNKGNGNNGNGNGGGSNGNGNGKNK